MCLTIPAEVIKIQGNKATIKSDREIKEINIAFDVNLKVNDWVLYISDIIVKKIPADEAREIIDLLKTRPQVSRENLSQEFQDIIKKSKTKELSLADIVYLLNASGAEKEVLCQEADFTRRATLKEFICIHGVIEFSSYCRCDCSYCGLNASNAAARRYRFTPDEIIANVLQAVNAGYKLLVLQSGEDAYYTDEMLEKIIKEIKRQAQVFIFLSIGERGYDSYKRLKEAGASGALLRFETTNENLFKKIHATGKDFKNRFEHLKFLKELGYYVASGPIIGLPGQTVQDLAADLLFIKQNKIPMISMGPFIPCPGTKFENEKNGTVELTLKMIAVARLMMPTSRIPCTTAFETLFDSPNEARSVALTGGANALMFILTDKKYRADYKIYPGREIVLNELWEKFGLWRNDESFRMLSERINERT
ncbi:MAG: [FeFe] hydrogenase H-cluster radical SAM maturase HydE [Patescibacteria group bacterium]